MFTLATVRENRNIITVDYISSRKIQEDIYKVFNTTRVNKYMFKRTGSFSFSIHSFFALELYHIIDILLNSNNSLINSKRTLLGIKQELLRNTWLRNMEVNHPSLLDYNQLKKFHFTPLDYQQKFMERFDYTIPRYNLNGMMLAADPGTGKTFTSLAIAECLHSDNIIVICPKPAVHRVWVASIANTPANNGLYKNPQSCWSKDSDRPYRDEKAAVIHYEALPYAFDLVEKLKDKKVTIILDESHNLNEIKSLRTLRFIDFCNSLKNAKIIFATGTPIKALSVETIPLFKTIDPLFTDEVLEAFKKMFAGEVQATTEVLSRRYNIVSYKVSKKIMNLKEPINSNIEVTIPNGQDYTLTTIANEMAAFTTVRTKELEKELPEAKQFFYSILDRYKETLSFNDKQGHNSFNKYKDNLELIIKAYKRGSLYIVTDEMKYCTNYEKTVLVPMLDRTDKEKFLHAKTLVKYLKLKVRGECLGRILTRKRVNAFRDMVKEFDFSPYIESTEKKTVIFTTYVEVIDQILKTLKNQDYNPLAVYGIYTKDLPSIVDKFEKKKEFNPLVATYASLSTAVPLIMADTMVIINPPFRQYVMDQTIARIHRLGSTTQTRIFNLNLITGVEPNICSRTIDIMQWSKDQVNAIVGIQGGDDLDETESVSMEHCSVALESGELSNIPISGIFNNW
jgi:superfamily II DNA or RNA helicase